MDQCVRPVGASGIRCGMVRAASAWHISCIHFDTVFHNIIHSKHIFVIHFQFINHIHHHFAIHIRFLVHVYFFHFDLLDSIASTGFQAGKIGPRSDRYGGDERPASARLSFAGRKVGRCRKGRNLINSHRTVQFSTCQGRRGQSMDQRPRPGRTMRLCDVFLCDCRLMTRPAFEK